MSQEIEASLETLVVTAGRESAPGSPMNVPLVPASSFLLGGGASYSRDDGTPTWAALESIVGGLEGGDAVAFASGMAAMAAVFDLLPPQALVAIPADCYHGVSALAAQGESRGRWRVTRIAVTDTTAWLRACETCDLVWLESPSNPLLEIAALDLICAAKRRQGSILVVDNTFATPLNQLPLQSGADIVVHSATKLIGGHSDLLCGIAVARDATHARALRHTRTLLGATPGVLECYLAARGARTLAVRLERSQQNALKLARRLGSHPAVMKVRYPGLPEHPGHAAAARQMRGFGTIVSFDVRGGAAAADAVCGATNIIRHATSLGGVESTMERRAAVAGQQHLPPSLLRLSVGIEAVEDLWRDLDDALRNAAVPPES